MTPALATSPRNGPRAPSTSSFFALSAVARRSASRARSQPIACTVAPAARASSATSVSVSPARPTSSRSGLSGAGRAAIANVAARPSPPVGPVISTVPGLAVVIALPPLSSTLGCRLPRDQAAGGDEGPGRSVGVDLGHPDDELGALFDSLGAGVAVEVGVGVAGIDRVDAHAGEGLGELNRDRIDRRLRGRIADARVEVDVAVRVTQVGQ